MNTFREYEQVIRAKVWVQQAAEDHNTVCVKPDCYSNCHVPCYLPFALDPEKLRECASMTGFWSVACKKCSHAYSDHRHFNSRWVEEEQTQVTVDPEAKKQFDDAKSVKDAADKFRDTVKAQKEQIQAKIQNATAQLAERAAEYAQLSLSGSFAAQIETAIKMLEQNLESMRAKGTSPETMSKVEESLGAMKAKLDLVRRATAKSKPSRVEKIRQFFGRQ